MSSVRVLYCGLNSYGQIGVGHVKSSSKLSECEYDENITTFVCGDCFTIYVTKTGEYLCAGHNSRGGCCLGHFNATVLNLTKIYPNIDSLKDVFGGMLASNLLWITTNGSLYINGWNENQQIGIGSTVNQSKPILIDYFKKHNLKVIYGVSGFRCNMVICDDGNVYSCGYGLNGVIGLGEKSVTTWTQIESLKNAHIIDIKIGDYFSLFLSKEGNVYGCGVNANGELGLEHFINDPKLYPSIIPFFEKNNIKIKKIECGYNHSIAIDTNGRIYSWGSNEFGQCGFGEDIKRINTPTLIQYFASKTIVDIKCGSKHSAAISKDNECFVFGLNQYGECGAGALKMGIPYLLNNELQENQKIINISLGHQTTVLLVENDDRIIEEKNDCIQCMEKEKEILKLKSELQSLHDDHKEVLMENENLKSQIEELKIKNIDESKYLQWDDNDILLWIQSLNDQYKQYEMTLKTALQEECVIGEYLVNVDKSDIKRWGIKHFKHMTDLFNSIQELINNNQQQNANHNLNEGRNAITEYV